MNSEVHGILVIDKPAGITSHDVVDRVRRLFRTRRVGHTGTLDPDATGVLVVCLGQATRVAEYLSAAAKHYIAEIVFGIRTDTMDASGAVLAQADASNLTEQQVDAILPAFRGVIHQVPPMVSARHHKGRRLYELAREGVVVERQPREVKISVLELSAFAPNASACATIEITCSSGTYIRVLADDIGAAAGCGAHMKTLRRTWVGMDAATAFTIADAHSLDALEERAASGSLAAAVMPLAEGLQWMPQLVLVEEGLRRLRHGMTVPIEQIATASRPAHRGEQLAAVLDGSRSVCAIVRRETEMLHAVKVLTTE